MPNTDIDTIIERSLKIRQRYHELELQHHDSKWTVEEDALAFLSDAGLVGRHTMSRQQRWPKSDTDNVLPHKLGESIWWLIVLASRMDIDIKDALNNFLTKTESLLDK